MIFTKPYYINGLTPHFDTVHWVLTYLLRETSIEIYLSTLVFCLSNHHAEPHQLLRRKHHFKHDNCKSLLNQWFDPIFWPRLQCTCFLPLLWVLNCIEFAFTSKRITISKREAELTINATETMCLYVINVAEDQKVTS